MSNNIVAGDCKNNFRVIPRLLCYGPWFHLWQALCVRYQWYSLNDVAKILFSMQKGRLHYLEITQFRHITFRFCHVKFIFCIILDILDDVWKFLFLFLITLTIPLWSPRNCSFTTFLTSEKIKEILSCWKNIIFSDSVTSH